MRKWWGAKPVVQAEFESQQDKLQRLTGEVYERYKRELNAEITDPERLAAVYGSAFASAESKRQAEVIALMASSMLKVANADVAMVLADRQQSIAAVREGQIVKPGVWSIDDSYCQHVIATGREFAVDNSNDHPLVCDTSFAIGGQIVSYLGVPIANRDGIIVGVLCTHTPDARDWSTADVSILTQLSFVLTRSLEPAAPQGV